MSPAMAWNDWPLPYVDRLAARDVREIELVVIHCTELPDLATARSYGERELYAGTRTGASGHFYVDRDGSIHRFVPETRVAHHVRDMNERTLGIELVNRGRWPDWLDSRHQAMTEPYPAAQIDALLALIAALRETLPNLATIAGHEDLDTARVPATDDPTVAVARKLDPGPLFPWDRIVPACGLRRRE